MKPEGPPSLSAPKSAVVDSGALLKVEVLSVNGPSVVIRTRFGAFSSDTHFRVPNTEDMSPEQHRKRVDQKLSVQATLRPGGVVSDVEGLDALFPEQRQMWWNWALVFGLALDAQPATKEGGRVALAEVPMSLGDSAALKKWTREMQLAGHESCSIYSLGVSREPAKSATVAGGCTKMMVRSQLTQPVLQSDVTKGLYLQRDLNRSSAVHGRGETRAQVSKDAGSLVRSDSDFEERSDVYFKADHSDSMVYKSSTKTHVEVRLLKNSLLAQNSSTDRP